MRQTEHPREMPLERTVLLAYRTDTVPRDPQVTIRLESLAHLASGAARTTGKDDELILEATFSSNQEAAAASPARPPRFSGRPRA